MGGCWGGFYGDAVSYIELMTTAKSSVTAPIAGVHTYRQIPE